ncbi:MAG TPA: carboxypeptidase-like regulatory domain-containing protein, partial [Blastocatellia bacterium]|nr:carboxypeptidase-like regulatory domain-containing protein [Blastocatellia bacterium]
MSRSTGVLVLTFLAWASISCYGQSNTAVIRGTVTDKTNAVVSGAKLRLTNSLTNYSQETTTDAQGGYRLVDVPFNTYKLTVESYAFEPAVREVIVRSNLSQQIDVQLGVAPVRQEVNV